MFLGVEESISPKDSLKDEEGCDIVTSLFVIHLKVML
jgi:hypothetical protein